MNSVKILKIKSDRKQNLTLSKMEYRGINDPVHGWTQIPLYAFNIIDTPLFQRLGYVTQLTLSNKVFPSANNTRKEHCLGVMNLSHMYSNHLKFDEYTKKTMGLAALLHDIGHGPFSHSWDRSIFKYIYPEVEKGHDEHRKVILHTRYGTILEKMDVFPDDIVDCWSGNHLHRAILQGPMGVDRMDFTSRDTFFTGTRHFGHYDIARIIENSSVIETPDGERLCYDEKIYADIIQALETRNKMYEQVYYHKTSVAIQLLLEQAIEETKDKLCFVKRTQDLDSFQYLTDAILFEMIPLSSMAHNIYIRRFPKLRDHEVLIASNNLPGCVKDGGMYRWTSPILTNNYESEFSKHDIYINTKKSGPMRFKDFWRNQKESLQVTSWQINRVYSF